MCGHRSGEACFTWCPCCFASGGIVYGQAADKPFVRVSPRDPRYFELSDGRPYIPIGLNMIAPPGGDPDKALAGMGQWMGQLSANGGNFIRVWLSNGFFDIEHCQERRVRRAEGQTHRRGARDGTQVRHPREDDPGAFPSSRRRQADVGRQADPSRVAGRTRQGYRGFLRQSRLSQSSSKRRSNGTPSDTATIRRSSPGSCGTSSTRSRTSGQPEDVAGGHRRGAGSGRRSCSRLCTSNSRRTWRPRARAASTSNARWNRIDSLCFIPGNDIAQVHRYLDLGAARRSATGRWTFWPPMP